MASKHLTRSSTKNTNPSPSKPIRVSPKPNPNPKPKSNSTNTESGSELERSKRRRLIKGKAKTGSNTEEIRVEGNVVAQSNTRRILFRELMPEATSTELDKLRLTKDERERLNRVAKYNIHGGRCYPKVWCDKHVAFTFFKDFLKFQEWEVICRHSGPVYPIEILQFYASVSFNNGCMHATVNGLSVSISVDELCALFSIPNDGIEINPSEEWGNLSDDEKLSVKKYFDMGASMTSTVLTGCFSPKVKFLFNFLWNTIIPRRGGRDKVSSYEMVVVKSWLEGVKVNLGLLIVHRILQISKMVTEEKEYSTFDLTYGTWLSYLLEHKNVVDPNSYGILFKDEMNDTYLKFMKITTMGPELIFQVKGNSPNVATPVVVDKPDVLDLSSLENKLEKFMDCVLTRLDRQEKQICDFMSKVVKERDVTSKARVEPSNAENLSEILALLHKIEATLGAIDTSTHHTMHECIRSTLAVQNLASQGGELLISGRTIREEMGTVFEAVRALILKVVNFDTCLTAQANHVRTCLDRLETLEFRTRPGYVNPNNIRYP